MTNDTGAVRRPPHARGDRAGRRPPTFLVAASGTGGHLLPALHVARAIVTARPDAVVEFVGSGRPLEEKLVDPAGFRRHVVRTSGLRRLGVRGAASWAASLPRAARETGRLIRTLDPHVVIGVGGYSSFLPVTLAALRRIPTWIHEAEREPGLANYVLSFYAGTVSAAEKEARFPRTANVLYTGAPMKREFFTTDFVKPSPSVPPRVFVTGGSQGARGVDEAVVAAVPLLRELSAEVRHQCRPESVAALADTYSAAGVHAEVTAFVDAPEEALRWCDVVVARSGAGTVREVALSGRPAVLVPLPDAVEQRWNAGTLEARGQAVVAEEGPDLGRRLGDALRLLLSPEGYAAHDRSASPDRPPDAAAAVASRCLALAEAAGAAPRPGGG